MLGQGFVKNYSGLLATRFFLGLAEAGVFPGSQSFSDSSPYIQANTLKGYYLISFWYRREEAQRRFTVIWCSVLVATMFGGLLASAIATMDGIRNLSNWRWIFILEGIATILIGILSFFTVSDFPEDSHWLTSEEKDFLTAKLQATELGADHMTIDAVLKFFRSPEHISAAILYFGVLFAPFTHMNYELTHSLQAVVVPIYCEYLTEPLSH